VSERKKIFVIGSGRSGTHLVGNILDSHPDIAATIEEPEIFEAVTTMALDPRREADLFPRLVDLYVEAHARVPDKHYADKSHPNIWLAEDLAASFDEAVFVGIQRNPHATVASMLRHDGVTVWHERWRDFPVPNRFLGIDEALAAEYEALPLETKFAIRWRAHADQMARLREILGPRIMYLDYDRLLQDERVIGDLQEFLELDRPFPPFEMKMDSLDKWRSQLSDDQVAAVSAAAGAVPV
jgi:Sulfotransferase family